MHQTTPYVPVDSNHLNFKPSVDKSNHHKKKHVSGELGEPEVGNIVNLYLWVTSDHLSLRMRFCSITIKTRI